MAAQKSLIPPLTLYRQILRAHRTHLPPQFRILGDGYVKAEFHRHKSVDNPLYIVGFIEQWTDYLNHILTSSAPRNNSTTSTTTSTTVSSSPSTPESRREETLAQIVAQGQRFGRKLDSALLDKMSDQQLGQLYELRKETKGLQSQQELDEIAKEEAQLFEKVAHTLPESVLSSSKSS
ncbi:ACN9-domain-containing protein [Linnemannia elongata AG-77]|uniref:Succinate dehydrogenase assembly factor 3 n=1 Tax=Linnemannia elongata AG-77 TaxID=1314771 RepID=A0A197JP00_9FUNG|nr:ACN9-domain-containing protein [Linnemannia elongata AG-77]